MMALILAAGEGSRLFPFTAFSPKPLLPVGGRPLAEGLLRQLGAASFRQVVLAVATNAALFEAALGNGSQAGVQLRYARSAAPEGKAGEICKARTLIAGSDDFLCIHGDLLVNLDLAEVHRYHRQSGALATVVASTRWRLPVGVLHTASKGQVTAFEECPNVGHPVSIGLYYFSHRIFSCLDALRPAVGPFELGTHVLPHLAAASELAAYTGDFPWIDVGTVEAYRRVYRGPTFDGRRWPIPALAGEETS